MSNTPEKNVHVIPGIRLGTTAAGIKYPDRDDLLIIELVEGATAAAVFTQNAFCAAPVVVAKEHLSAIAPRYLLVNSGNANAGTGAQGLRDARESCQSLAAATGCAMNQILPFSTGVIGENLPVNHITQAIPAGLKSLSDGGWERAAEAIMTTDTRPKISSRQIDIDGHRVVVTGIAKGSGMIRPDMATMLAYVATDASVDQKLLQQCLQQAVTPSFNAITVDGDTSTNDACVLMASGSSECPEISSEQSGAYLLLSGAVRAVCMELARSIIKDGEGATRLVDILVEGGNSQKESADAAYTIAHSPLVKTALFAGDPNWGRILAAVGRAGISKLDIDRITIWLGDVCIVRDGGRAVEYTEEAGQHAMDRDEILIRVDLGRGAHEARVLTCDLSYDYVRINAEYRS
ncbi:MAG: bifunctional glutamate N-acetyltransferase/amino-acid acetyltransferase ArgJ [Gammaproteobacteria bacterium]|nr:bifunctional glutamate N-acetyltransferase/amino-acid acetyltransferase ArgJ [Gammaproteobacteria bacterium]